MKLFTSAAQHQSVHLETPVPRKVSDSTIRRLSHYLRALEELEGEGTKTVSSQELAERGGTTAAQVRKDFSHFGSFGKRGLGYEVCALGQRLEEILGLHRPRRVALVGAGRIGTALFRYPRFKERGYECVSILDNDPEKIGHDWGGVWIESVDELERVVRDRAVELMILAVPAKAAQDLADRAVKAGVRGILNFAPTRLRTPDDVAVTDVNLVMEMEAISFAIAHHRQGEET